MDATLDYFENTTTTNHAIARELFTTRSANTVPFGGVFSNIAPEALYQRARPLLLVFKQKGEALSTIDFDAKEAFGFFHDYPI